MKIWCKKQKFQNRYKLNHKISDKYYIEDEKSLDWESRYNRSLYIEAAPNYYVYVSEEGGVFYAYRCL